MLVKDFIQVFKGDCKLEIFGEYDSYIGHIKGLALEIVQGKRNSILEREILSISHIDRTLILDLKSE